MTTDTKQTSAATAGAQTDGNAVPDVIMRLMSDPPLLPTESIEEFIGIFENFTTAIPLRNALDYYVFFDITVLTFEVIRYRRLKIAILKNQERPAVEGIFSKLHPASSMKNALPAVATEASQNATKWFSDPAYRKTASKTFELAGYADGSVEAEAFARALPDLSSIERLIVSAQRRLNAFLKELTVRNDKRVATMRATATDAINKKS